MLMSKAIADQPSLIICFIDIRDGYKAFLVLKCAVRIIISVFYNIENS